MDSFRVQVVGGSSTWSFRLPASSGSSSSGSGTVAVAGAAVIVAVVVVVVVVVVAVLVVVVGVVVVVVVVGAAAAAAVCPNIQCLRCIFTTLNIAPWIRNARQSGQKVTQTTRDRTKSSGHKIRTTKDRLRCCVTGPYTAPALKWSKISVVMTG